LDDADVDGRIILKWISEHWDWGGGMDWINLAQDRNRWRAVVNAVMNLRVPYNAGNFLSSWGPVSFSEMTVLHVISNMGDEVLALLNLGSFSEC
jgi:hypothetical protein